MFSGILTAVSRSSILCRARRFKRSSGVTHVLDTSKMVDTVKFSTAKVAERDVVVARMHADS
jgi:hypothetical protein